MADLQVVFLRDMIRISSVRPDLTKPFPALRVVGTDMDEAVSVLINGVESPQYLPISRTELIAEIPSNIDVVASVAVLTNTLLSTARSVVVIRLNSQSSKVSGIVRLVQRFITMLLTSPGTDLYRPSMGGGLQSLIARTFSRRDSQALQSIATQAVRKTVTDLIEIQSTSDFLAPDERIASAQVTGVTFDARTTTLAIQAALDSEAGRSALANLFL